MNPCCNGCEFCFRGYVGDVLDCIFVWAFVEVDVLISFVWVFCCEV
jgi:hypothetical protein